MSLNNLHVQYFTSPLTLFSPNSQSETYRQVIWLAMGMPGGSYVDIIMPLCLKEYAYSLFSACPCMLSYAHVRTQILLHPWSALHYAKKSILFLN